MLPEFDYCRPGTLAEALALLAEGGPALLPVAGGTNVIPDLRAGRHQPRALLDVWGLAELRGIRSEGDQVVIGAGTTLSEILDSELIAHEAAILHAAAANFANPLVRNRATLGGNLADASPAADMAPPLLALDARVELSQAGAPGVATRCLPLADFLVGVRRTQRRPGELITAVTFAKSPRGAAGAYHKLGLRKSDAIAVLSVAVYLACDDVGRCTAARIALGALAPRPFRATEAEAALLGAPLTPTAIVEAARLAGQAVRPISDIRGSAGYRRQVSETITRRLLTEAARGVGCSGSRGGGIA